MWPASTRMLERCLANALLPGRLDRGKSIWPRPSRSVVVTREGDRFSASVGRGPAGRGVRRGHRRVVDEATRERAEGPRRRRSGRERKAGWIVPSGRDEKRGGRRPNEACGRDDRAETRGPTSVRRTRSAGLTNERSGMTAEIEGGRPAGSTTRARRAHTSAEAARLAPPGGDPRAGGGAGSPPPTGRSARSERVRIDDGSPRRHRHQRKSGRCARHGLVEGSGAGSVRSLDGKERRITGHADERQQAPERRRRLEGGRSGHRAPL